jgi:hypothetical protein
LDYRDINSKIPFKILAHSNRERAAAKRKNHSYRRKVSALCRIERVAAFFKARE